MVASQGDAARGEESDRGPILTEKVAYWFFRLNGCLTIENFVVHPDFVDPAPSQRTDADILGVRFPHRQEDQTLPMIDSLKLDSDRPLLFIAEVKLRACDLNGPWTRPERGNVQRVLRAVGLHEASEVDSVAQELYRDCRSQRPQADVRLCAVGDSDTELLRRRPNALTFTWREIFEFVHDRFSSYSRQKRDNHQWESVGRTLFRLVEQLPVRDDFVELARAQLQDERGRHL